MAQVFDSLHWSGDVAGAARVSVLADESEKRLVVVCKHALGEGVGAGAGAGLHEASTSALGAEALDKVEEEVDSDVEMSVDRTE